MSQPKGAFFLSYYKRPEYLHMTLDSLKNQDYENIDFYIVEDSNPNTGLRNRIIDFFDSIKDKEYDFLMKGDADCIFPKDYITEMVKVLTNTDADILSPNVMPSNAAFTYGKEDKEKKGYRSAEIVGGLWMFRPSLIKDIYFERHELTGLTGATTLLQQIVTEKEPKVGWVSNVTVEDVGHWSGQHKEHIRSKEHYDYYKEVGRSVAWSV